MEQPPACLAIQGLLRPAFIEEQSVIQKHLSANQSSNTDISEPVQNNGEDVGVINGQVHNQESSRDNVAQEKNTESSNIPANVTSFFKLEMVKIQLFSAHGHPVSLLTCVSACFDGCLSSCLETSTMNLGITGPGNLFLATNAGVLLRNLQTS